MKNAFIYSAKVWFTTLIIAILLYSLTAHYFPVKVYYAAIHWAEVEYCRLQVIWFLPILGLFVLIVWYVNQKNISYAAKKRYLTISSILLCLMPLVIAAIDTDSTSQIIGHLAGLFSAYSLIAIICLWVYNLKPVSKTSLN